MFSSLDIFHFGEAAHMAAMMWPHQRKSCNMYRNWLVVRLAVEQSVIGCHCIDGYFHVTQWNKMIISWSWSLQKFLLFFHWKAHVTVSFYYPFLGCSHIDFFFPFLRTEVPREEKKMLDNLRAPLVESVQTLFPVPAHHLSLSSSQNVQETLEVSSCQVLNSVLTIGSQERTQGSRTWNSITKDGLLVNEKIKFECDFLKALQF